MFDGTLGTCKTDPVEFELKEDSKPICLQTYPVPKLNGEMLKEEVDRLVILGFLDLENDSERGSPSLAQPKPKPNQVSFLG